VLPLLLGICTGFLSSIPPFGPGALLLMRRGLEGRASAGLAAAAGGALADAIYCGLAAVGFSYLLMTYPEIAASMRWVGVLILSALGIWFIVSKPELPRPNGEPRNGGDWPRHIVLGFSLGAFNPTLLITWTTAVAMVASLGGVLFTRSGRIAFPVGVALGDIAWAAVALFLYRRLGHYLPERVLRGLMRGIGLFLLALATFFAVQILFGSD
jgi:threonine/homoserine/homoserine lactone efflux protein